MILIFLFCSKAVLTLSKTFYFVLLFEFFSVRFSSKVKTFKSLFFPLYFLFRFYFACHFCFILLQQEMLGHNDLYYGSQGPPSVGSGPRNYAHSGKKDFRKKIESLWTIYFRFYGRVQYKNVTNMSLSHVIFLSFSFFDVF